MGKGSRPSGVGEATDRAAAVGRAILLVHLTLSPLLFWRGTVEVFEPVKVALLLLTALLLAALGLTTPGVVRRAARVWREPLALGALLFLLSAVLSTVVSVSPRTSLLGGHESYAGLLTVLGYVVLFFATRALVRHADDARRLLLAPLVGAAAASSYAVVQLAGLDPVRWQQAADLDGYVRPFGPLGHPNFLAAYLVMALPVCVFFARRAMQQRHWLPLSVCALTGALSVLAIVAAVSRGAWLALACVGAFLGAGAVLTAGRRIVPPLAAVGGAVLVLVALAVLCLPQGRSVRERVARLAESPGRQHIWQTGLAIFRERPLLGCGLDTFPLAFARHRPPAYWEIEWGSTPARAHNEAIHVLATQGLVGAAAILGIAFGLLHTGRRVWRERPQDRSLLITLLAMVVGFGVQDLFSFTVAGCGTLFVTCAALLSRWNDREAEERATARGTLTEGPHWPRRLIQAGVWSATALLIWKGLVVPLAADYACQEGLQLRANDRRQALAGLERATALVPWNEYYWSELGRTAHDGALLSFDENERRRLLLQARRAFEQARALVPANPYHHANLGWLLAELARAGQAPPAQAYAALDEALRLDPANAYFYVDAAHTAFSLGDLSRARDYCRRGERAFPTHAPLRAQQSWIALAEFRFDETLRLLEEALTLDWHQPGCPDMAARLPTALYRLGRHEEAQRAAQAVLEHFPDCADARAARTAALEKLGRPFEALNERSLLALHPDPEAVRQALHRLAIVPAQ